MKLLMDIWGAGLGQHMPEEGSRLYGERSEKEHISSSKAVSSLGWTGLLGKNIRTKFIECSRYIQHFTYFIFNLHTSCLKMRRKKIWAATIPNERSF